LNEINHLFGKISIRAAWRGFQPKLPDLWTKSVVPLSCESRDC